MRSRRSLVYSLAFGIFLAMHASPSPEGEVPRLGHVFAPELPVWQGAERFAKLVRQLERGVIDLVITPSGYLCSRVERTTVLEVPFLFASYAEADRFLEGKVGKAILRLLSETALGGLGYFETGFVGIAGRTRAVKTAEDYRGLRIRIGTPPMIERSVALLGAQSVKLPPAGVYKAVQQGFADATLTTALGYSRFKYNGILPFLSMTHHVYASQILIVNESKLDRLAPDFQQIITDAALEASGYERALSRGTEDRVLRDMEERGVEVVRPHDIASMREAVEPVYEKTKTRLQCQDCKIFPWCCLW